MTIGRRQLALAGAAVFAASGLLKTSSAVAADDPALGEAVENLRKAIFAADKAKLAELTADNLSYGHSDARVQNKAEFIDGVVSRKATVKSLDFPELKVMVTGEAAVARHLYVAQGELDGKTTDVKIGTIEFWQKQAGAWKLLGRQGFKLA